MNKLVGWGVWCQYDKGCENFLGARLMLHVYGEGKLETVDFPQGVC